MKLCLKYSRLFFFPDTVYVKLSLFITNKRKHQHYATSMAKLRGHAVGHKISSLMTIFAEWKSMDT